jgi:hypothetical protein
MKAMLSVLVSPKATFERIRDQGGHFVAPFIAILLIAAVSVLLTIPLLEHQLEQAVEQAAGTELNAAAGMTIVVATAVVGALFGTAASIFIEGLLLMLVNLVVRGEASYMQLVKVSMFAGIPALIQGLIVGAMAQFVQPADLMNMTFSLADLLDSSGGFQRGLLQLVNPFTLWGLGLMVIGTSVMARQPVKRTAVWLLAGWLVIRLIFVWIGTLFGEIGTM